MNRVYIERAKKVCFFCLMFFVVFTACKSEKNTDGIFRGELVQIEKNPEIEKIIGDKIQISEPFAGFPFVFDSLIFFTHPRYKDYSYYCINLNTGKLHAKYIKRGRGPNEFKYTTPFFQIIKNNAGENVSPFMAINEREYGTFNLDKSIRTKQTVLDTIYKEAWGNKSLLPFTYTFSLGKNTILARNEPAKQFVSEEKYTAPVYFKFTSNIDKPEREFKIYSEFHNANLEELNQMALVSADRIRPDNRKLVMAMYNVNQINILDIETGELKGFLMSGAKSVDDLNQIVEKDQLKLINKCIEVDQNNIYVLNVDQQNEGNFENTASNTVNVFDWDGNFVRCLKLSKNIEFFTVDSKRKLMYGVNTAEEAIYRFKL